MASHPYPARSLMQRIYNAGQAAAAQARKRPQHERWAMHRLLLAAAELDSAADTHRKLEDAALAVVRHWKGSSLHTTAGARALERLSAEVHDPA